MKNIKTQSLNSEETQPSMFNSNNHSPVAIGIALARGVSLLCSQKQFSIVFTPQSHAAVAAQNDSVEEWSQNDGVGKNLKYVILRSNSDVRIHNNNAVAESGRSMIEMLGVLAIIGVLSITAIAGYSYAMRQNRVNELTNQLKTTAYHCMQQYKLFHLSGDCDISSYQTDYGYATISDKYTESTGANVGMFEGTLTGLDADLCKAMKNRLDEWNIVEADATSTCSAETNNTIAFRFNMDLSDPSLSAGGGEENERTCPQVLTNPCKEITIDSHGCTVWGENKVDGTACTITALSGTCQNGVCQTGDCPNYHGNIGTKNPDTGACCWNGLVWMSWGGEFGIYNDADYAACGVCPSGGEPGSDAKTCCKNGREHNGEGFYDITNIPVCGCPDSGDKKTDSAGESICCKNGYAWDGSGSYSTVNFVCGCPDSGDKKTDSAGESICCKNGYAWDGSSYSTVNSVCGCPDNEITLGGKTYCYNDEGYYWINDGDYHISSGFSYDGDSGYYGIDPRITGKCPKGKLYNNICCAEEPLCVCYSWEGENCVDEVCDDIAYWTKYDYYYPSSCAGSY